MKVHPRLKRYFIFTLGLLVSSFGIAFITKASLGTSPISSVPYVLSLKFTPTLGMFTLYMSLILVIGQLILLRKKFPKEYWLQIPVSFVFSWFIDLAMNALFWMTPDAYLPKLIFSIIGAFILGFGVFLEFTADVVMLPGESFCNAVSIASKKEKEKIKVLFDCSMALLAILLGFLFFGKLVGIREGTLLSAILVGNTARQLKPKNAFIKNWFQK